MRISMHGSSNLFRAMPTKLIERTVACCFVSSEYFPARSTFNETRGQAALDIATLVISAIGTLPPIIASAVASDVEAQTDMLEDVSDGRS
jgi:hypothetical protein